MVIGGSHRRRMWGASRLHRPDDPYWGIVIGAGRDWRRSRHHPLFGTNLGPIGKERSTSNRLTMRQSIEARPSVRQRLLLFRISRRIIHVRGA